MNLVNLVMYCPECNEEIIKPFMTIGESQEDVSVDVNSFAQTTWDCGDCGESFS